jgi:hypothetical protein
MGAWPRLTQACAAIKFALLTAALACCAAIRLSGVVGPRRA